VSATKPCGQPHAPARHADGAIRVRVVIAMALLFVFAIVGGFGVTLNDTRAILVGGLGFAVVLVVAYLTPPARRWGGRRSRSTERA
jgi:heme A synthase